MIEFRDDEAGYLSWIASNPDGFVLNVRRTPDPDYVVLHRASCRSISTTREPGAYTCRGYRKICAADMHELRFAAGRDGAMARFQDGVGSAIRDHGVATLHTSGEATSPVPNICSKIAPLAGYASDRQLCTSSICRNVSWLATRLTDHQMRVLALTAAFSFLPEPASCPSRNRAILN
jgi:hypothetical protein